MRILLLTFSFICCFGAQAQLRIGAQAGVSRVKWVSSDAAPTSSGEIYSTSGLNNMQGGIVSQLKLSGGWQLRSGLMFTGKGTARHYLSDRDTSNLNIWLRYLELPIALLYQRSFGRKTDCFVGAGGYGAYGIDGVAKGEGRNETIGFYTMGSEVEFSKHNETNVFPPVVPPIDYGYILLAGIEHGSLQLLLTYSQGLKILQNPRIFNGHYKNRVLSLSAAYFIPTKWK